MDKYTCEYIEKELKWLGEIHNLKVLTEIENDKYVHAYYIDKNQLDRTMRLVIDVKKLNFGWLTTADEAICNRFDIKLKFTYIDTDIAFEAYCKHDVERAKLMLNSIYGAKGTHRANYVSHKVPKIKDVKFNGPATIVFWADDTKTVVKAHNEDIDYEKGLAMAIAKKALGNKGNYFNEFKKWLPEEEEEILYPKFNIPSLSNLFKPGEFSFEVTSTSINGDVLKELTRGAGNQTVQMTFEGIMKTPEKEPERVNSKEFIEIAQYCEFRRPGYGWHGDNHTIIEEYCEHTDCLAGRGDYCCEQNCPRFALKKGEK